MRSAKEMFEELGYKLYSDNEHKIRYIRDFQSRYKPDFIEVEFFKYNKSFIVSHTWDDNENANFVKMNLNKAIQQQLKELGWI